MRPGCNCATRFPSRSFDTVTALCRFTAQGPFMPSSLPRTTSDGTPRIVDVIGATVTRQGRRWRCRASAPPPAAPCPAARTGRGESPRALFFRPRCLRLPRAHIVACLRPSRVPFAVAIFLGSYLQSPQMLAQRFAHQSRAIRLHLACGPVGSAQKLLVEHHLDRFHMWILFHSLLHSQCAGASRSRL